MHAEGTPARYRLRKIRAGLYQHRESGRFIVHTIDVYEGPRGGSYNGWEHAKQDRFGGYVIDSPSVYPTLQVALDALEDQLAAERLAGVGR